MKYLAAALIWCVTFLADVIAMYQPETAYLKGATLLVLTVISILVIDKLMTDQLKKEEEKDESAN